MAHISYQDSVKYLNSFLNLEKNPIYSYKESLKLERVKKAATCLEVYPDKLKTIHIAGTKGKGSTAHFLAYCLASLGYKVGIFSSPHFFTFRERIKKVELDQDRFKEKLISRKKVAVIIADFKEKLNYLSGEKPTYFELLTLMGFKYFQGQNLDYVIVEVGLGGRLDSTNIIKPELAIITHIGYDHMHLLGNSLSQIASEKAGIIKDYVPVISCYQRKSAAEAIKKIAKQKKSNLYFLGEDFKISNVRVRPSNTFFDFQFNQRKIESLSIYQKGYYQAENASLALAGFYLAAGKEKNHSFKLKKALKSCSFEGRFELLSLSPLTVVDVAHNKSSAFVVSDNLKKYFPNRKVILIFACSTDKKPNHMLSLINYDHLILTQFNHLRSYNVFELKEVLWRKKAFITINLKEALTKARSLYDRQSLILICGSFFLAAEAKTFFKKEKNKQYARV